MEQSWKYIKIAHRYMNVGTEGAQFLFREYINRIFFAVEGIQILILFYNNGSSRTGNGCKMKFYDTNTFFRFSTFGFEDSKTTSLVKKLKAKNLCT